MRMYEFITETKTRNKISAMAELQRKKNELMGHDPDDPNNGWIELDDTFNRIMNDVEKPSKKKSR